MEATSSLSSLEQSLRLAAAQAHAAQSLATPTTSSTTGEEQDHYRCAILSLIESPPVKRVTTDSRFDQCCRSLSSSSGGHTDDDGGGDKASLAADCKQIDCDMADSDSASSWSSLNLAAAAALDAGSTNQAQLPALHSSSPPSAHSSASSSSGSALFIDDRQPADVFAADNDGPSCSQSDSGISRWLRQLQTGPEGAHIELLGGNHRGGDTRHGDTTYESERIDLYEDGSCRNSEQGSSPGLLESGETWKTEAMPAVPLLPETPLRNIESKDSGEERGSPRADVIVESSSRSCIWHLRSAYPSINAWKLIAIALALGWTCSVTTPLSILRLLTRFIWPTPLEPEVAIVRNTTLELVNAYVEALDDDSIHLESLGPAISLPAAMIIVSSFALILIFVRSSLALASASTKAPGSRPRSRSISPLLDLTPSSIDRARQLMRRAQAAYHASHLDQVIDLCTTISKLSCARADKALAFEYLGRAHYRLSRASGRKDEMERAVRAFEQAVRLSVGVGIGGTARASLGRAQFRLGRHAQAIRTLRAALKNNDTLSYAHEYIGRAYFALPAVGVDGSRWSSLALTHLRRACELDTGDYTARAYLSEQLHLRGCLSPSDLGEARDLLRQAVAQKHDLPAAHVRLGFIANEKLDPECAARHFTSAIETRETGLWDEGEFPGGNPTRAALEDAVGLWIRLWLALSSSSSSSSSSEGKKARALLDTALEHYPAETVLQILRADAALRCCPSIEEKGSIKLAKTTALALGTLQDLEQRLSKRVARFSRHALRDDDDHYHEEEEDDERVEGVEAQGLYALVLLVLGRERKTAAEDMFANFRAEMIRVKEKPSISTRRSQRWALLVAVWEQLVRKAEAEDDKPVVKPERASPPRKMTVAVKKEVKREDADQQQVPPPRRRRSPRLRVKKEEDN